jgi:hypothetical protein
MNLPKTLQGLINRLIFGVVGAFFAMFTIMTVHGGKIRSGRFSSEYVSVRDEPVQFWLIVGASALISVVAFYCALTRGKR